MASLIPGFEYDIFISYRQKDNKYDGWVTEFVDNLKRELEATFKEEISVYFDINPHDGLLDTHDVDASLREKLKCLIFIPVISRTYCDPKSFAWEHEFIAFIDHASHDEIGLKINLPDGNVSNRVLPVRIYDLDLPDIKLCESVLGSSVRNIDFVYKEPGVNRPLTPEDDEEKNQNNTRYRNQINKTANTIKEIISGLQAEPVPKSDTKVRQMESWENVKPTDERKETVAAKKLKPKIIQWLKLLLLPVILLIGAFAVYKIINLARTGKTIAVLFSADVKDDTSLKNIAYIYAEAVYGKLRAVKRLTVRPWTNMLQYMEGDKSMSTIRKDLSVNYLLYGNIRRSGNEIIIWIELTSEKANKVLWSDTFVWERNQISQKSTEIIRIVARNLNAKLTPDEIKEIETEPSMVAEANLNYALANAISFNAWVSYNMANKYFESISYNSAIQAYDKAIMEDSLFALAYAKRAIARAWGYYTRQVDSTNIGKCLEDINTARRINKDLPEIQTALGFYYYYCIKNLDKALEYFRNAADIRPEDYQPLFYLAMVYRRKGEWINSQNVIKRLLALDPQEALCLTNIGISYTFFHKYDSALMFHQKAIDIMPAWESPYKNKIETLILKDGITMEARALLDTGIYKTGGNFTEHIILLDIYEEKYSEALKDAEKSHPTDFKFKGEKYLFLADIYTYLRNSKKAGIYYDSALVTFTKDLVSDRNNPEIHSYMGMAWAGLKNKGKAVEEGKKAIDLIKYDNFEKSDMIINLARICTMAGDYEQAIDIIDYLLQMPLNIPSCLSKKLLQIDPVWWPLSGEPKYQLLLKKY
jgi:tetratricopeptide (TPR) repeat protein